MHDDRMDSFFLSETLPYLYLLVVGPADLEHLPVPVSEAVFSTEGHMFPLPGAFEGYGDVAAALGIAPARRAAQCAVRPGPERAGQYAGLLHILLPDSLQGRPGGQCAFPPVQLAADGGTPGQRFECFGVAASYGPAPHAPVSSLQHRASSGEPPAHLRALYSSPRFAAPPRNRTACDGLLDEEPAARTVPRGPRRWPGHLAEHPHRLVRAAPPDACTMPEGADLSGSVVLARRGHCTFVQKSRTVQRAGAVGLVVVNTEDRVQVMTALSGSSAEVRGLDIHIPSILVAKEDGERLEALAVLGSVTVSISAVQ